MIIEYVDNTVLLTAPGVQLHPLAPARLQRALQYFNLHSTCPLAPAYHRRHGIFECNQVQPYRVANIHLPPYCLMLTTAFWQSLNMEKAVQIADVAGKIIMLADSNQIKHGLVCNAIVYI